MIGIALRLFGLAAPGWMTPAIKWLIDIALVLAFLGGLWALHAHLVHNAYNRAFDAGWASLATKDDAARKVAEQRNVKANAQADTERVTDTAKINTDKEARDVAIKTAPASATGAATRAAGCVRWRAAHPGATPLAACR
jgi:hypothetical protein